ncbi:MAG: MerR family transcriptional regulator [Chloroflexi bacterium]|nr:MerR family transcriptional regulator [Chloroflexota bacterium]MBP8057176.1 MerR family transcriptional regulator [Chloroflexota bacterium]
MFKIGDFSKLGQVSTRMLRHYDQMGLLKPSQTDEWTGYRYYTIEQLARLHRIIALKGLGFSLEQVANLLNRGETVPALELRGMLKLRQAEITRELQEKQSQLASVETRLQQIEQEGIPSPYETVVKSLVPQTVVSWRQVVPHIAQMTYYCQTMYEHLYAMVEHLHIVPVGPELTLYHNDEYRETDLDVEVALPVMPTTQITSDSMVLRELPGADLAAALIYEGPIRDITPAILALLTYVGTHNHIITGPLREYHLSGPVHQNGQPVPSAIVELQIPIAENKLGR